MTFFARVGDTATNVVRLAISDQFSRPEAGLCNPSSTGSDQCYDSSASS